MPVRGVWLKHALPTRLAGLLIWATIYASFGCYRFWTERKSGAPGLLTTLRQKSPTREFLEGTGRKDETLIFDSLRPCDEPR
jgi:hypothetical protein